MTIPRNEAFWFYLGAVACFVFILVFSSVALAQEDAPDATPEVEATPDPTDGGNDALKPEGTFVDDKAPVFPETIQVLPLGTLITFPPTWATEHGISVNWSVGVKAFLLPEAMYDVALTKAKQLDICRPALDHCTDTSLSWMRKADEALQACETQMDDDEELIASFQATITSQDQELATVKLKLHRNRTAAGVSWAITGGIIAGLVTTAIIVSAP